MAEPDMGGHARHHRAGAPRHRARRGVAWRTPLLVLGAVVALVLSGVFLVDTGGPVAPAGTLASDPPVPPRYIPLPTAPEPGARVADGPYNAKDADPPRQALPTAQAPAQGARVQAGGVAVAPPVAGSSAPAPPVIAPKPQAQVPPEPGRGEVTPAAEAPVVPRPPVGAACSTVLGNARVVTHVAQAGHHLAQRFRFPLSQILGRGGRTTAGSDHPSGRALDFMVFGNGALGDAIAAYAVAHRRELGITYVIWKRRIDTGGGFRLMEDRGSPTANHFDHVHISFGRTPGPGLSC